MPRSPKAPTHDSAEERAAALVAQLGEGHASAEEVFAAFAELDTLPESVVRKALSTLTGEAPDLDRLDDATRAAHRLPPRPLHLRAVSVVHDADILDLEDIALEQLRLAGRWWDGTNREPEERLDEEIDGSFAGTLERRVYVDAADLHEPPRPLFDVMLFAGDSGVIFASGTTTQLGSIADGVVEMRDRRARDAVREALASAAEEAPLTEEAPTLRAVPAVEETPTLRAVPAVEETPMLRAVPAVEEAPAEEAPAAEEAPEAEEAPAAEEAPERPPAKKRARAAAKTAKRPAAKAKAERPAAKKAAAKKTTAKKTTAKTAERPPAKKASAAEPKAKRAAGKAPAKAAERPRGKAPAKE